MNVVELKNGTELACNNEFYGLFERAKSGDWRQLAGTVQTPKFKNPAHLIRFARGRIDIFDLGDKPHPYKSRRLPGGWR